MLFARCMNFGCLGACLLLLLCPLLWNAHTAYGWQVEVKAKGAGPLEGASAVLLPWGLESSAGSQGLVTFPLPPEPLPAGQVAKVRAVAPGYGPAEVSVHPFPPVDQNQILTLFLEPLPLYSERFVIRARRKIEVSQQALTKEEFEKVPGTGGDAGRALQTLPSVVPVSSFSADIAVRGSSPGDNRYFLDRLEIPFAFHLGGLGTVVPTRMLVGLDLFAGGFSALYTDALGGIVQLRTDTSVPSRHSGEFEWGLLQSSFYLEGPLGGHAPMGYRTGFRRTYLEVFRPIYVKASRQGGSQGPDLTVFPQATDYQFMLVGKWASGTWQTYLLGASNRLGGQFESDISRSGNGKSRASIYNYFQILGARAQVNLGEGWGLQTSLQQRFLLIDNAFFDNVVNIRAHKYLADVSLDKRVNEEIQLTVGVRPEWERTQAKVDAIVIPVGGFTPFFDPDTAARSQENQVTTSLAWSSYLDVGWRPVAGLNVNPGVAFLHGVRQGQANWDPRLGVSYGLTDHHTIKGSWGLYSQRPEPAFDSKDYGNPRLKLERSRHFVGGVESQWSPLWVSDIQVYRKDFFSLVGNAIQNPELKYDNQGRGHSYGAELFIKKQRTGRTYGWLSYGLSRSQRWDPVRNEWQLFRYDRTHTFNVLGAYKFSGVWECGTRVQYVSGAPYTRYPGGWFNQNTGRYRPITEGVKPNEARLPAYFRWDVRSDTDFLWQSWKLSAFIELQNITFHKNVSNNRNSPDYSKQEYAYDPPFIPNLGVKASF